MSGTRNRVAEDVRSLARELVQDDDYRRALAKRIRAGTAGPMEPLLWSYAYGEPSQLVAIEVAPPEEPVDLSADQRRTRPACRNLQPELPTKTDDPSIDRRERTRVRRRRLQLPPP